MSNAQPGLTSAAGFDSLPDELSGTRSPIWWGIILLVTIESTVFATLFSSYFYLRFTVAEWPPAGVPQPDLLLPIINTGVLLTSSVAVYWATSGVRAGNLKRLKIGVGVGIGLELVFFTIKLILSSGLGYDWSTHAYGSIFMAMDRLHTLHVFVAIAMACVVEILALRGYFTRERRIGVEAINIYWQFVAIVWLPVFFVLFLVPRWF